MPSVVQSENVKQYEDNYNNILGFYDLAERLIDSVEHPDINDKISYLDVIEPVVQQFEGATDTLSEEYRNFVATGKKPGFLVKIKIEKALESVASALIKCKKILEEQIKSISLALFSELMDVLSESEKKLKEGVLPAFAQLGIHIKSLSQGK
jgi:hypothetical protein